ncbi:MAG: UvrD-helicase domain-containing protein [Nitrospiraceae bacterium]|nr:UvrD-helicase domain-containing protein [Nitrospiraceae bacterium]
MTVWRSCSPSVRPGATTVATFHSLCARLIRQYADRIGLPPGYSIYDTADQKRAIKQALEDLEINSKNFPPRVDAGDDQ